METATRSGFIQECFSSDILNANILTALENTVSSSPLCTCQWKETCTYSGFVPTSSFQDLDFASQLVKQSQVSAEVLLEALRLLLPSLPESELLSITDALCPKQHPASLTVEQEHVG